MTLYKAESPSITVTDGTVTTATPLAVTVAPSTPAKFALTATTTTPTAGAADNLTVTAQDAYGNTATSYTGSHNLTFSGPAASPSGKVPTVSSSAGADIPFGSATAINFSAGVSHRQRQRNGAMKLYKSGAVSLKVGDGTLTEATLAVTVAPATAAKLALTAVATTLAAGESDNLTITALDTYGNTATAYAGSKSLTFSGAAAIGANKPTVANSSGNRDRLRDRDDHQLHRRHRHDRHLDQERGDEDLRRRRSQRQRQRRHHLHRRAAGSDSLATDRDQIGARRRDHHTGGRRSRQPHGHRPGHIRQHRPHLYRR